jgi:hypothetical protein
MFDPSMSRFLQEYGNAPPLDGETTAGRYLRELRALRQGNQDMLQQIEAETGHSFGPADPYTLGPVWPGMSAETPGFTPPQAPEPPPAAFADASPAPPPQPQANPAQINPDAIVMGAQQAQTERSPWQTTTQAAPNPYMQAFSRTMANFEPETPRPVSMGLLSSMGPPMPPPSPSWLSNPLQQRQPGMQRAQFGMT